MTCFSKIKMFIYDLSLRNCSFFLAKTILDMEDVKTTTAEDVASVEKIKKWSPQEVHGFLEKKKDELFLKDQDIKIIEDQEVAGQDFLLLTNEVLERYGLKGGPATRIAQLIKEIKGEEQGN